jgi:hypothetical protein
MWIRDIKGVQYISFAQLARDVQAWSLTMPQNYFSGVAGLPRSGLTVAHMLGAHLNCYAGQVNAPPFRQYTARPVQNHSGPLLIVDDCCSFGTAIIEARKQNTGAEFGVVYGRQEGLRNAEVRRVYTTHAEPDWLVVTEWNWMHHQDSGYIAVTNDVITDGETATAYPSATFDAVYALPEVASRTKELHPQQAVVPCEAEEVADCYRESKAVLLVTRSFPVAKYIAEHTGKVVMSFEDNAVHGPPECVWG